MRIERLEKFDKFIRLRKQWNELLSRSKQNTVFLTHQWFEAWWRSFGKEYEFSVLLARDDAGDLIGAGPLMASDDRLSFMANQEVSDYCDFIIDAEKIDPFYELLLDYFQEHTGYIRDVELINIPSASPMLISLPRIASERCFSCGISESEVVPILTLPSSYEKYIDSLNRKSRHELRRKLRRLESLGQISIQTKREPQEMNAAIQDFISLHRKSSASKQEFWQQEGMTDFFRILTHLFSLERWVEWNLLYSKDKLIAGLLNFVYADHLYLYNVAFDREFFSFSPGFILFNHVIEHAIEENKKVVDFLRGGEKYKYSFGAKDSKIFSLTLTKKRQKSEDLCD
jgi:CelD/BcsL family acetyltransferase involved in cellulose biosynthesis